MRKDRMRARKILVWNSIVLAFLVILLGWLTTPHLQAQCTVATCEGWNGVYGSGSAKVPAYAFVDALPYMGDSRCLGSVCDLCDAIYYILFDYSPSKSGVVIDARGVATPQNCVNGTTKRFPNPWSALTPMVPYANVVLLPAGTINLQETWILPADTRIIGEGSALTTIQPCTTTVCGGQAFSGPDMIDMGSSAICLGSNCQAVLIEHLGLNGGNVDGTNGIVNSSSQELSYVSDVSFTNIPGTALAVETINAVNSGPYSKLTMSNVGTCVNLNNTYGTRGIHGLTCAPATSSTAGVLVDGGNNTIEDVSISGTTSQDGILVGANLAAPNNVLFNVHGSTLKNVVHISALSTDTSVLGVTNLSG